MSSWYYAIPFFAAAEGICVAMFIVFALELKLIRFKEAPFAHSLMYFFGIASLPALVLFLICTKFVELYYFIIGKEDYDRS